MDNVIDPNELIARRKAKASAGDRGRHRAAEDNESSDDVTEDVPQPARAIMPKRVPGTHMLPELRR